jgi:hypothetical protein
MPLSVIESCFPSRGSGLNPQANCSRRILLLSALAALGPSVAHAQVPSPDMPGMPQAATLIDTELQHTASGTSIEPASTPMQMLMHREGGWTLMLHGVAFAADTQQQAAHQRGADKLLSTNWIMPMARRRLGSRGQLTLRTMLSLEPATITGRFYPELFQQGETAFGHPIVDGQHPHDFVMELAALFDLRTSERTLLSLYAAPVGDPAIGPTAYPHRQSASEDPIAALGHHQQDSTHIAFNVLTAGFTWRTLRIETSGFHGAEPTEARWQVQPSPNGLAIDSASTRLTWSPAPSLSAQYSIAQIASPEALSPGQNQRRQTASVMLNRSFGARQQMAGMAMPGDSPATGNWASTLLWGQTRNQTTGNLENSYLLESLLQLRRRNHLWTRVESAARTTELLNPAAPETAIGHVQAYTLGYDRDYRILPRLLAAPGAQFTLYRTPGSLVSTYGRDPFGAVAFVRFRFAH